jgi:hypothetical protein
MRLETESWMTEAVPGAVDPCGDFEEGACAVDVYFFEECFR